MRTKRLFSVLTLFGVGAVARASYTNFEAGHVHPIDLTPAGDRLLAVNTPDAMLEVFTIAADGSLAGGTAVPVGLEPVTVRARTNGEAWVVNHLSDTVSVVDLGLGAVVGTIDTGDEPGDVAFAAGRAFVSLSTQDVVRVYDAATRAPLGLVPLAGRDVRALAVSNDGSKVYAVVLRSGNGTTILGVHATFPGSTQLDLDPERLGALGLRDIDCTGPTPPYPPLPSGIVRNPALSDPADGVPKVGLIVGWNEAAAEWQDELGQDWNDCLPYRPADNDLFVIDAASLAVTAVKHLGTSLFDVSVHPVNGKIYVPHTEARNRVRFEHELGVRGHVVDNRMAIVDPAAGNAVTLVDLNAHIDRESDPATNLQERLASVSQPGMMAWKSDGSAAWLAAIGSRKVFRLDGACTSPACIFGAQRALPDVVEVGEGPTGVVLREAALPEDERLYVLNRISHSIAVVRTHDRTLVGEVPLHDPSSEDTRLGRRFLYDGIDGSGHGDASCASCHLFGDLDGLAWDLGDPPGQFVPYSTPLDNVRFIFPQGTAQPCPNDAICAAHDGFDPQKGPMTTQTLRAMLEPLHWRGDRATMNDFNAAFVGLMGTADIGPINGKPAGLSAVDMERFRQFALAMRFPPNPYRTLGDGYPCPPRAVDPNCEVSVHGGLLPGNPAEGDLIFHTDPVDGGQRCVACHTDPFGAAVGTLDGVPPAQPTSLSSAGLFNGTADGSPHSDLKVPHLRNMYEKLGPVLAAPGDGSMPETASGFGFVHDGGIPDLLRFLSADVFQFSGSTGEQARKVRDVASFMFHFPTGIKPAVGRQLTLAPGLPPGGADGATLATLVALGDGESAARHCELTAVAVRGGVLRGHYLQDGSWIPDAAGDAPLTLEALFATAEAPLTFTCGTIDSGWRLGVDRDADAVLDFDDCAAADPQTFAAPATVSGLTLDQTPGTLLTWAPQAETTGLSLRYAVLGGSLLELRADGVGAIGCVASDLADASWTDPRPDPPPGDGHAYLVRAQNPCGDGDLGPGLEPLETLECL
jgi:YVTN family beta-propeller protein